jgi:hypothetical protein
VVGSFGSAVLGPALLNGVDFASMPPQGTRGIACQAEQCFFFSADVIAGHDPIGDQVGTPEGAVWSANGTTAVIYSRSGQWLRVLNTEPSRAQGAQQNVASLGGQLGAVQVSPDGQHVVFAITGQHSGVYEVTANGALVPLLAAENAVALAYSGGGETLYVLNGNQVLEIGADSLLHSWELEGVANPVGLQAGRDAAGRAVLYVAGGDDHSLFVYDGATHQLIETIPLSFAPTQVEPAGTGSYFLTSRNSGDELLWSFTTGRGAFFVPVTPLEATPAASDEFPQRKVRR